MFLLVEHVHPGKTFCQPHDLLELDASESVQWRCLGRLRDRRLGQTGDVGLYVHSEQRVLKIRCPLSDLYKHLNRLEAAQGHELVRVIASLHPIVGSLCTEPLQVLFVFC